MKSGIKKSLGSLRLSPRNRPKLNAHSTSNEATDGPSKPEVSLLTVSKSSPAPASSSGSQQKAKRKDIMQNYHQDTVSLDSVSVSSTSEFSAAGTDDRSTSSPLGDGESSTSGPMDILGGGERLCLNGGERSLGFSDPISFNGLEESPLEISESSFRTVDSGINVDRTTFSFGNGVVVGKGSSPKYSVGKGLSHSPKHATGKGSTNSNTQIDRKDQVNGGETSGQAESSEQDREEELSRLSGSRSGTLKEEADPLGMSGTQSERATLKGDGIQSRSDTLKEEVSKDLNVEELLRSCEKLSFAGRETASCAEPTSNGACSTVGSAHTSPAVAQAPNDAKTEMGGGENGSGQRGYANVFVARPEDRPGYVPGGGVELRRSSLSRKRSKSNSPCMHRKPKPLPRKSLTNKQILTESMKNELLSSLPANFKPIPLPRPPSLTNGMSSSPSKQKPLKSRPPHSTIQAAQGISTISPHKSKVSNSSSPLRMEGLSNNSTPRYRSPSGTSQEVARSVDTPQHGESKKPPLSAPCTPHRAGISAVGGGGDTPTLQHSSSTPSTPLLESSNPSSPHHGSSTSNLSSDVDSGGGATGTSSDPVPPPRRKRKSSRYKSQTSKDSLFPVNVLPVSPEEPSPEHEKQLGEQPDGGVAKEKQSLGSTSSKSHDPDGSESSRSRDLSEDDLLNSPLLLEESGDVFKEDAQFTPPSNSTMYTGIDRNSKFSIGSSNRTSRTSLTVFADSTGQSGVSSTMRPYSVMAQDGINMNDSYERISESYNNGGGHTLPRIAALNTWTPRQQRQSMKALMPASSKCGK